MENKEVLFTEIKELKKLVNDIETESIHNFNASIVLEILNKLIDEKQNQYFA